MAENPLQEFLDDMRAQIKAELKEELKQDITQLKPDVLDGHEAAEMLRISYWKVSNDAKNGKLPCFKVGNRVLFRRDKLLEWAAEQENAGKKGCKIRRVG